MPSLNILEEPGFEVNKAATNPPVQDSATETDIFFLILITIFAFVAINIYLKNSVNKDPKEVVVDEFVGQSIPIFMYEISHGYEKLINDALIFYFIIFILFRIYDILKPFPINYIDKNLQNAVGVILDDVMAGIYTVITLIIIILTKFYFL